MLLLLVIVLFPLNLIIEWLKWQLLLKERVSWWWGMRTISTGMMAGLVSLNGLGDFAGRVMYLPVHKRIRGSWAAIASGLINFWAVILVTLPIFPFLMVKKGLLPAGNASLLFKICAWLGVFLLLLLYTRAKHLPLIFSKVKILKGWKASFEGLGNYSRSVMGSVLALAVLRFLIFNTQLNILWHVFGLQLGFLEGLGWSMGLYGILALVPTVLITDLGVRGGVALWLLSDFATYSWQILLPTYLLWLLNVILPSLFGWLSMWFLKKLPADTAD